MAKRIRFKNFESERIVYITEPKNFPKRRVANKWIKRGLIQQGRWTGSWDKVLPPQGTK